MGQILKAIFPSNLVQTMGQKIKNLLTAKCALLIKSINSKMFFCGPCISHKGDIFRCLDEIIIFQPRMKLEELRY